MILEKTSGEIKLDQDMFNGNNSDDDFSGAFGNFGMVKYLLIVVSLFFSKPSFAQGYDNSIFRLMPENYNFPYYQAEDFDSTLVLEFDWIEDSCQIMINYFANKNYKFLKNVRFIEIGYYCDADSVPSVLFDNGKIEFLSYGRTGVLPNFKEKKYHSINDLHPPILINPSIQKEWQENIFSLKRLKTLFLSFDFGVVISDSILTLDSLTDLTIYARGNIVFPENFNQLLSLQRLTIKTCDTCESFPAMIPLNISYLNFKETGIKEVKSNLSELKRLRGMSCSRSLKAIPIDFDLDQLTYFSGPELLFSREQWEMVERVVEHVDRIKPKPKNLIENRGAFPLKKRE